MKDSGNIKKPNKDSAKQKPKTSENEHPQKRKPENSELDDLPNVGECFKCRQVGHVFKDCLNSAIYKYFCYSCGTGNFTAIKCPNCKDRKKEND